MNFPEKPSKTHKIRKTVLVNGKRFTNTDSMTAAELYEIYKYCKFQNATLNLASMQLEYMEEKPYEEYLRELTEYKQELCNEITDTLKFIKQHEIEAADVAKRMENLNQKLKTLTLLAEQAGA